MGIGVLGLAALSVVGSLNPNGTTGTLGYGQEVPYGTYSKNLPARHPPPILLGDMYGKTAQSSSDASSLSGMTVKTTQQLPSNTELKMIKTRIEPDTQFKMVTSIYAPKQIRINENSTFADVMDYNGLIIVQTKEQPNFDISKWIDEYGTQTPGASFVTVHGKKAIGISGDPMLGQRSQIIYYDKDVQVILVSVGHKMHELLKMAESMP